MEDMYSILGPNLTSVVQTDGSFTGVCIAGGGRRIYGGQVLAQALWAAGQDLSDTSQQPSSMHAHFIAAGDIRKPVRYVVSTVQETRRFVVRRVEAEQDSTTLALATVTFHTPETSDEHSVTPPRVRRPELCPSVALSTFGGPSPAFEPVRARLASTDSTSEMPSLRLWLRGRGGLSDDALLNACALAWLSDLTLTRTVDLPRQHLGGQPQRTSLNHAIWFHRTADARDWLLADQRSESYADARGIATAQFFHRSGDLLASATQECLIRREEAR